MKHRIKLTESDLHRIVKQSVKKVLKEEAKNYSDPYFWKIYWAGNAIGKEIPIDMSKEDYDTPEEAFQDGLNVLKRDYSRAYAFKLTVVTPDYESGNYCVPGYEAYIQDGVITKK